MIHALESSDIDPQKIFEADQKIFKANSGSIRNQQPVDQSVVV